MKTFPVLSNTSLKTHKFTSKLEIKIPQSSKVQFPVEKWRQTTLESIKPEVSFQNLETANFPLTVIASLQRRTTRGPLDEDEEYILHKCSMNTTDKCSPLSATMSPLSATSARTSALSTPLAKSQDVNPLEQSIEARISLLDDETEEKLDVPSEKNLAFLLDTSIYHPLSQVDIPLPFRKPFTGPPPPGATVTHLISQLEALVAKCDFVAAAHYAAVCLTSGIVQPSDYGSIFKLLAVRYSCLELIGQVLLAAQEAKALEDLSSEFYYHLSSVSEAEIETHNGQRPLAKHIMPFSLRVQAIRLQNIGFSDPRRGVTALYDLGLEAREHLASPYTTDTERNEWSERLESLSVHVVNALIELGDLDCAQRTLMQSKPNDAEAQARWVGRMVLILVRLGQLKKAQAYIDDLLKDSPNRALLSSISAISDGRVDEGAKMLEDLESENPDAELADIAKQNLAVAYLYLGRIQDAKILLDRLIEAGYSFQSLTVNLATIFDLVSDKSRDQKIALVNKLASTQTKKKSFTNADFKL